MLEQRSDPGDSVFIAGPRTNHGVVVVDVAALPSLRVGIDKRQPDIRVLRVCVEPRKERDQLFRNVYPCLVAPGSTGIVPRQGLLNDAELWIVRQALP